MHYTLTLVALTHIHSLWTRDRIHSKVKGDKVPNEGEVEEGERDKWHAEERRRGGYTKKGLAP